MASNIVRLKDRIEENYEDFKADTLATLTKKGVFELAGHISAIEDVRFFMSTHDWLDEDEADYLLSFDDPLEMLACEWEDCLSGSGSGFGKALDALLGRDGDEDDDYDYFDAGDFDEDDSDDWGAIFEE